MTLIELLSGPFITEKTAEQLRRYAYHGEDRSVLAHHFYPFWKSLIGFFPLSISPNIISLIGILFPLVALIVALIQGLPPPPWYYALYACCLVVYQTMDALDGLQGRRVDMYNNPTTEIFDHGCDSSCCV